MLVIIFWEVAKGAILKYITTNIHVLVAITRVRYAMFDYVG